MNEGKFAETAFGETEPKFEYEIYYAPHETLDDFHDFEKALSLADVYVPEALGWREEDVSIYREITEGRLDPEEFKASLGESALFHELKILYKSQKPIYFADLPEGHPLIEEIDLNDKQFDVAKNLFLKGQFNEASELFRKASRDAAKLDIDRENFIKHQITFPELARQYSDLTELASKKGKLKVLLCLGASHTRLYHQLKKDGHDVVPRMKTPVVYPISVEVMRRFMFKKEVSDDVIARALIGELIYGSVSRFSRDTQKTTIVARKLATRLDTESIRSISESIGAGKNLTTELASHGIAIPQSETEINEMLNVK